MFQDERLSSLCRRRSGNTAGLSWSMSNIVWQVLFEFWVPQNGGQYFATLLFIAAVCAIRELLNTRRESYSFEGRDEATIVQPPNAKKVLFLKVKLYMRT
jgi:hypothetical protein